MKVNQKEKIDLKSSLDSLFKAKTIKKDKEEVNNEGL